MKKIPTLFKREFENHRIIKVLPEVTDGFDWVLNGEGVATIKWDGSCCSVMDGRLYKRYDAKNGKPIPHGAIKCQEEADPVTGHLPCWIECDRNNASDKWFWAAYDNTSNDAIKDGTFEAVGKHFNGNPYKMENDILIPHGKDIVVVPRTFDGIKEFLKENYIEGIVFWLDEEPKCKIKRSDFGFAWSSKH